MKLHFGRRLARIVNGYFYPLTYSHYLELLNPLWTSHRLQAKVIGIDRETADCVTVTLQPGQGWHRHRAGQYLRVQVSIDGSLHNRTYSVSSAPERRGGLIAITVKTVAGGRVSTFIATELKVGSYLLISQPQGEFVQPEAMPTRPLFVTAGSGITPVMAMLRSWAARGPLPDIVHVHYAPRRDAVIFAAELEALRQAHPNYKLQLCLTQERTARPQHLTSSAIAELCPDWRGRDVWVCGPQSLCEVVTAHWAEAKLSYRCHAEYFHAALAPLPEGVTGGLVRFAESHLDLRSDGKRSLLEVAEDAGIAAPHGCRMGICHSCDAVVKSGHVRDLRSGQVLACEPGQRIQICVCAAAGDCELVA